MFRIQRVDGTDEEYALEIKDLHDDTFGDEAPAVDTSHGDWWMAYADRIPVAFAGLTPSLGEAGAGYLCRSGVLLGHRGHGLQRRLIRCRERLARSRGWLALRTDTTNNPSSSNNLIRCGYRIFAPSFTWGFNNTIYWRKDL